MGYIIFLAMKETETMQSLKLKVMGVKSHTSDVKTFRLRLDEDIPFKPGQYLIVTVSAGEKSISKPLSISSSPTEKGYIEFTKKLTSSGFSAALNGLKEGDECSVRMPMGRFTFEGEFPKTAFLSGGIGITPIRSIFKYAADTGLDASLILIYSGRVPQHLIFREEFEAMARTNKNIKLVYTLTDCDRDAINCRRGRIDAGMIRESVPDLGSRKFYICGPPGMVGAMRAILADELALSPENIITEDFFGY
jgi:ferredoxin-NADP reductase